MTEVSNENSEYIAGKIGIAKVLVKGEEIYVSKCIECNKLLTADEASYGHDCE